MSVKTYTDSTTRIITKTIEEHVWEIRCDAIGCNNSLEFRENQDTGDITADGDYTGPDMDNEWLNITTPTPPSKPHSNTAGKKATKASNEATSTAPHTTKTNKTPTTKKETTPALAGIGKGEPMTALLASPLGSIETGGQSVLYRCHPRMMYDESVRKPLLDILGRWALHLMCDAEEA